MPMLNRFFTTTFCLLLALGLKADCVLENGLVAKEMAVGLMLTWTTSEETDNAQFIIEKAEAGETFGSIGNVKGAVNSTIKKDYNFLDIRTGGTDKVMFRLKIVDTDGTYSYSEVTVVNRKKPNNLMVVQMSSETTSRLYSCAIDAFTEGAATVKLIDAGGQTVWTNQQNLANGLNTVSLDLSNQREGTYKLVIGLNGEEEILTIKRSLDAVESKINVANNRRALGSPRR
jgi:hypothetical protein